MKKFILIRMLSIAAAGTLLTGCASTGVQHSSPTRERPLTEKFDPDDAQRTVEFMVDSMLQFGPVVQLTQAGRPVLDLDSIQNRTMEHIDTRELLTSLRTRLLRTGLFRFKDRATTTTDITIMNEENELGLVDRRQAVKPGSQSATQLYLSGEISQKRTQGTQRDRRLIEQYYYIMLTLKDLSSGEIIWTDEQRIKKERTRPIL